MMAMAEVSSMREESQTVDEGYHLLAGYQFLKTGTLPYNSEQTPLAQAMVAIPLLVMDLRIPDERPSNPHDDKRREHEFLYENVRPMEEILMRARAARLVTTLLLGVVIAWWMRRHFGLGPALASVMLFAFDPNFLAHGHYTTIDAPIALSFLWACLTWNWFLKTGTLVRAVISGLVLGIALGTKFTAVALFPIFVALYAIQWWQKSSETRRVLGLWHLSRTLVTIGLVSFLVLFASFRFRTGEVLPPDPATGRHLLLSEMMVQHPHLGGPLRGLVLRDSRTARVADTFVANIPFPAPDLFRLLYVFWMHAIIGHEAYLLGKVSQTGWWYYFPVAFVVKTPTGDLLLLFLAVVSGAALLLSRGGRAILPKIRTIRFEWFILAVPPLIYFATCILSKIDIGLRHLLPIYPFLFMGIGAILFSRDLPVSGRVRVAAVVGIACVLGESVMAYPNYLAFFNAPSGGMRNGSRYLVDSNLDWGQDVKRLARYIKETGSPPVCLAMLGDARPEYYGIIAKPFPADPNQARQSGCVLVISLTTLKESNTEGHFDWLTRMTPVHRVGGSLLVYDITSSSIPQK
jgi:4-amino-4-deoxy-L-arabinose transferase-like glycosyltransferase